mgnify:CR=1 FL=1
MATQQQQQQPPHSNYTKIDDGDDLPNAAESAEVRNPLAPPSTPEQLRHEQLRQPLAAPEDEADGSKFRAVVAAVRCMVGPGHCTSRRASQTPASRAASRASPSP